MPSRSQSNSVTILLSLKKTSRLFLALISMLATHTGVNAQPTIAIASNFKSTMTELLSARISDDRQTKTIFASSGKLVAQISNGAPIDIFLSAEPIGKKLDTRLVVPGSEFTYAYGQLALVSHKSAQHVALDGAKNLSCLAIANPKLAPYGRAALEVIARLKRRDWQFERIVQGQSVAQAFQFFDSGACNNALVAYSQVLSNNKSVHHSVIPSEWHAPIQQNAVLLKRAENATTAEQFLKFLRSESARKIIQDAGYLTDIE